LEGKLVGGAKFEAATEKSLSKGGKKEMFARATPARNTGTEKGGRRRRGCRTENTCPSANCVTRGVAWVQKICAENNRRRPRGAIDAELVRWAFAARSHAEVKSPRGGKRIETGRTLNRRQ